VHFGVLVTNAAPIRRRAHRMRAARSSGGRITPRMDDQAAPVPAFGDQLLERFAQKNPLAASLRLVFEQLLAPAELDAVFEAHAERQYTERLAFSTLVDVMGAVVTRRVGSVHAALQRRADTLGASFTAFYNKLNGAEPAVAAALVHHTAARARALLGAMGGLRPAPLTGWRVRVVDGNHLAATERRLAVLHGVAAGPRPGFGLVVFDPAAMLATDVVPCEDAHAQERALTDALLDLAAAGECWIADRNFCTRALLFGLAARAAAFVIRQHANLPGTLVGPRRACGRVAGGAVFEQALRLEHAGAVRVVRRVTLELEAPTRDGDTAVHVLTDLPPTVAAGVVAELYLRRWTIEGAFADVARWLDAELAPLGYPRAALLGFCVGLMAYNAVSTLLGALRATHGDAVVTDEISGYYIAEFGRDAVGMIDDLVEPSAWRAWRTLPLAAAAALLKAIAARIELRILRKAKRGPKTPVPKRTRFKRTPHVATQRLLDRTVHEIDSPRRKRSR
jgi:hypothetical protein